MKTQFLLTLILVNLATLPLMGMNGSGSNIPTLTAQQSDMLQYLKQYEQQLLTAKSEGEIQVYLKSIQDTGASQESDCPFFTQYIWHFMQKVFVSGLSFEFKHMIITQLACFIPLQHPCRPIFEQTKNFLNNKINPCSLATTINDPLTDFIAETIQTNNLSHLQELLKYADDPTHKEQLQSACQTIQEQSQKTTVSLTTAANSAASATPQQITLQTHDGNEHKVTEVIINQCETLEEMVEECGDTLPLPRHITTKTITNLIALLGLCHTLVNNPEDLKQKIKESLKTLCFEELVSLLVTANYVQAPQIVFDMLIEQITTCIFNKDNLVTNLLNPQFCSALRQIDSNLDLRKIFLSCKEYKDMYSCLLESSSCTISVQNLSPESCSWSPDGSCIAVKSYDSTRKTNTLTLITKDGITKKLCSIPKIRELSWSPDGSCIAVVSYDETGDYFTLTLVSTKDGTKKELCSMPNIRNISWSPDCSCIAVVSTGDYNTLTLVSTKNGTKKDLCSKPRIRNLSWSPDCSCIAVKSDFYPNDTFTLITKDGTTKELCSIPDIRDLSWSPDGSCIAVKSYDEATGNNTFTLITKDGTTKELCSSISGISDLSWSPDGSCIAVTPYDLVTRNFTLTLFTKDGTKKDLCSIPNLRYLSWSPDCSCIAVKSNFYPNDTFTLFTKNTLFILITKDGTTKEKCYIPDISDLSWSPDGSCIAVESYDEATENNTFTLFTKDGTQLCSIPNIRYLSWSPDGSCIAISSKDKVMICKKEVILYLYNKINLSKALLLLLFNHCIKNNQTACLEKLPQVLEQAYCALPDEIKNALPESIKKRIILHMPRLLSRGGIWCLGYFKKP